MQKTGESSVPAANDANDAIAPKRRGKRTWDLGDETHLAISLSRLAHSGVQAGQMRPDIGLVLLGAVKEHLDANLTIPCHIARGFADTGTKEDVRALRVELMRICLSPSNPMEQALRQSLMLDKSDPAEWTDSVVLMVAYGLEKFRDGYEAGGANTAR